MSDALAAISLVSLPQQVTPGANARNVRLAGTAPAGPASGAERPRSATCWLGSHNGSARRHHRAHQILPRTPTPVEEPRWRVTDPLRSRRNARDYQTSRSGPTSSSNDRSYEVIGIIGTSVGILAILVVAVTQGWTPVLEPLLVAGAPAIDLIVGALAGLQPSWKASRIQPTEALRR